ncbi:MAG: efflux RND transporter periplasmic adaptor subunit [Rhodoferax sp.]|jgi:RND family efflux transporter MFP subunit|uniref:efflux RND transporter periplasmic adaptor subunit n=1 Tax=Rhodoferax sp. TaxID=50421 RepID=UPI001B4CF1D1|nr:efflux RND transporter periplasmic adaptor subunit [Rhodoferax sp.]MBP9147385.1 efflux RND transporter periplasmic adaptor subunit [Rhodoferax sp.]MBP9736855.1 efflux RND transporter periplasmic adaptor subunit [Rhodoferax sp.]
MPVSLLTDLLNGTRSRCLGISLLVLFPGAPVLAQGAVQVPVAAVQVRSVGNGFEMDGVVQPVKQATVSAQTGGRLLSLTVKTGDKVRSGQVLATIDDSETQTGVQRGQAQIAQAQAEMRNAQVNLDRTRELLRQGFVSAAALDNADTQLKGAAAARDQAAAAARQAGLAQAYTRVTAPFDGWVLQTEAEAGDLAAPGKPLLTLYAPLPMRAVVQVPVSRSNLLGANSLIELQVPAADGAQQWIRPVQTSRMPSADAVSQTIEWRLELPGSVAGALLPGQQIRVRFAAGSTKRLTVPAAAILRRGELTAVYVVENKSFVLKAVRLGSDHGSQGFEVLAGLREADQVALDPVRAGLSAAQVAPANTAPQ